MDTSGPARAENSAMVDIDNIVPTHGYNELPVVGLGGSAGSIPALTSFLRTVPANPGMAFVVVMHLSADHDSALDEVLRHATSMPVVQVRGSTRVEAGTVYVIPPRKLLRVFDGSLQLGELPADRPGRVAIDLFFRTLADTHGPHAVAIVLSGADGDGATGIKRIKERGGLTIAQDPQEAQHETMPQAAIATGMVDWVLPVGEMARRVLDYVSLESRLALPPEDGPPPADAPPAVVAEKTLRDVLSFLRTRTGRDFGNYKRATILRRIGRRMQVNGVHDLGEYLHCLRTLPGEAGALLQDLLISVTNFFRDADCFAALEREMPALFRGKSANGNVRVWVAGCATGEEAYTIAMLLAEHARTLDAPPSIQVFATDLDEEAIAVARDGLYPSAIAADVSEDRLRTFFAKEHRGYRVRRELRETVLFAVHDVLKNSPFSRLDLLSCRNLLIYLNREAQQRVFETAHFALVPDGRLFLGASETVDDDSPLFFVLDKKHRLYAPRPLARATMPVPSALGSTSRAPDGLPAARGGPVIAAAGMPREFVDTRPAGLGGGRTISWAELHFKMLEALGPPSVLIDGDHEIIHLSPGAARFLQFGGGEPSRNLLRTIHPELQVELRGALFQASMKGGPVDVEPLTIRFNGEPVEVRIGVRPMGEFAPGMTLVLLGSRTTEAAEGGPAPAARPPVEADPLSHHLDRELERMKVHLRDTVEQYEASTEELKASNEELQAMNEELRSATEELETSREELQSINEELTTVNQELKGKVDELGNANSDMQNLMDATAIATIFLDRELHITRYTPSAVALFNLIPTDIGRPLSNLKNHLHYPGLADDAQRVLQGLIPIEREVDDSRQRWYLVRMLPYRTIDDRIAGVVLTLVDITERKSGREALRSSEEWLRLVVDSAVEYAIFSMDLELRVTSWNAGAQRLLGFAENEILGQPADVIFTPEDRADGVPAREARTALTEGRALDERIHQRKDAERFWASGVMTPMLDDAGNPIGLVKVLRDQTAERAAREALAAGRQELLEALDDKEKARLELEAADQAKDRFLAVLSHELRNPLAAIGGAAETLANRETREAHERAVRIVRQQVSSMRDLLDDLLDVSRLRLGRLTMTRRRVALRSVVDAAVEAARTVIERRGHALRIELPVRPVVLDVDPSRISQVLSNLLVNAAKYTDEGGHIELVARAEGANAVLTVTDDGMGLDGEALDSMFEMFWQSTEFQARSGQGMGIGLSLVRSIVQMHGGTVEAESRGPGLGSAFTVRLPLAATGDDLPLDDESAQQGEARAIEQPRRIVLADDNEDAAWSLATVLGADGHQVTTAADGEEALARIEELRPDVAVLDIAMPGIDGYEVARRVRAQPWGRTMLLVAATGWGNEADRRSSSSSGFDAHLVKPIDLDRLRELMARWPAG